MESTIFYAPGTSGYFTIDKSDSLQLEINEETKYLDDLEQKSDLKIEISNWETYHQNFKELLIMFYILQIYKFSNIILTCTIQLNENYKHHFSVLKVVKSDSILTDDLKIEIVFRRYSCKWKSNQ